MPGRANAIVEWIRQQVTAAAARGLVVGLSGGVDSAVVARLCQMAMPGNVVAVLMPCQGDPQDDADAHLVADQFTLPIVTVDLAATYEQIMRDAAAAVAHLPSEQTAGMPAADPQSRVALANVKSRLRMTTLYFVANSLKYLVAGTGNRSELMVGYFTKHGDGGVDLLPIGGLLKHEVRNLARELEVPEAIIEKPPSAGLWAGQTDEQEMGFTYADLERYLTKGPEAVAPALAMRIERLVRASEHKRAVAPTP